MTPKTMETMRPQWKLSGQDVGLSVRSQLLIDPLIRRTVVFRAD